MSFNLENEWQSFLDTNDLMETPSMNDISRETGEAPCADELYISTKSLINYLTTTLDINNLFWNIPVLDYSIPSEGIIKKQIKVTTHSQEELTDIYEKLSHETRYIHNTCIHSIINPEGRIKFKDVRKISVGLSKRDLVSHRPKKVGAFYNCLAVILRVKVPTETKYREMHVKLFNTGKIEIPGIQTDEHREYVLDKILTMLNSCVPCSTPISFYPNTTEIVLINSNFNCNFYINRDVLYDRLQKKYSVQCVYEPCSYPGIHCKYVVPSGVKVSYMIFRTGSVLIVGKCSEVEIYSIYEFVKGVLCSEYMDICQSSGMVEDGNVLKKTKKTRTKTLHFYDS